MFFYCDRMLRPDHCLPPLPPPFAASVTLSLGFCSAGFINFTSCHTSCHHPGLRDNVPTALLTEVWETQWHPDSIVSFSPHRKASVAKTRLWTWWIIAFTNAFHSSSPHSRPYPTAEKLNSQNCYLYFLQQLLQIMFIMTDQKLCTFLSN